MATTDRITPAARRSSIRLTRPVWIGVTMVELVVVAGKFRVGVVAKL